MKGEINLSIIAPKDHTMNFFYCDNAICLKMSCTVCHKIVERVDEDYDYYDEEFKKAEGAEIHFKCWEYKDVRANFEECLEKGGQQHCPNCNLGG